ncbi:MAG: carboxylating nicotinate-nucleotide diphosphorylase [Pseudomonadota bacterium]
MITDELRLTLYDTVSRALDEDLGSGDLTADLVDTDAVNGATVIAREACVLAGQPWFDEVFRQLDDTIIIDWYVADGGNADTDDIICKLVGPTRAILSGERTALNFLQTLSATATQTRRFCDAVHGTAARILDTRKTLPGLRTAQKYAVRCGGGHNHRMGLFDAILIKENHIQSAGGISAALKRAQTVHPDVLIEIEVETLDELHEALDAGAGRILLDNFALSDISRAVEINKGYGIVAAELEVSGNVTLDTARNLAETGINYLSVGSLTKHVQAIDLSMLLRIS